MFKILAFIALVATIEACQTNTCTGGSACTNTAGRRRRSVQSVQSQVEDVLADFNTKLKEALAAEISAKSEAEKEQFWKDLDDMNKAVVLDADSIADSNRELGVTIQTRKEFAEAVLKKVAVDFKDREWFQRLQTIGGDKITRLAEEMVQNLQSV